MIFGKCFKISLNKIISKMTLLPLLRVLGATITVPWDCSMGNSHESKLGRNLENNYDCP